MEVEREAGRSPLCHHQGSILGLLMRKLRLNRVRALLQDRGWRYRLWLGSDSAPLPARPIL